MATSSTYLPSTLRRSADDLRYEELVQLCAARARLRGLPFELEKSPGAPTARLNSVRYVWHQTYDLARGIARAPATRASYARIRHIWGLAELVPGRIYRGAEPRRIHFAHVRALGIRTLLCVKRTLPSRHTLAFAYAHDLTITRVNLGPDREVSMSQIERVLHVLQRDDLGPLLLHCDGGRHRTGIVTAALRGAQGWALHHALSEYEQLAQPTPRRENREAIERWFRRGVEACEHDR